jgi:thiosulfate/3-mercaptopyruvate sulfurtransferase
MPHAHPEFLMSAAQLAVALNDPDLVVLDCTSGIAASDNAATFKLVTGEEAFRASHIPGSQFVDIERDISSPADGLLFTFPPVELFADSMTRLGVGAQSRVVVYSTAQPGWAARVWLMLRAFGFDNAAILDGGFQAWTSANLPVEQGDARPRAPAKDRFKWTLRQDIFVSLDKVDRRGDAVLVNALGPDSFRGDATVAYGRPGHIPGSINVPTSSLVDPATGKYFDQKTIEEIFARAGVKQDDAIIAYCGAGIAASNVVFARLLAGAKAPAAVFDGSLLEWSTDPKRPLVVGK